MGNLTVSNGKGSRHRSQSKKFNDNYNDINWDNHKKIKNKKYEKEQKRSKHK